MKDFEVRSLLTKATLNNLWIPLLVLLAMTCIASDEGELGSISYGTISKLNREEKGIHHHRGNPPFFMVQGGSMVQTLSGPTMYALCPFFLRT